MNSKGSLKSIKIMTIAGARPNFMKVASLAHAISVHNENSKKPSISHFIVHTGQHYDEKLSRCFFDELNLPKPDINLGVGSGTHAVQTAEIMRRFEPVLLEYLPDILIVVGDVNSTIACALVAAKIMYDKQSCFGMDRPLIVHVEAGLRSFDRKMPEEINRILTDALSDVLFVTEESGVKNLQKEGISADKIYFVGNVMIDTLNRHIAMARKRSIKQKLCISREYGLVTLHRPSNVDSFDMLKSLVECLGEISKDLPLIFPVHPRTKGNLEKFGLIQNLEQFSSITLLEPLSYLDFLNLLDTATLVLTDSGGIQEETTVLQVPCITLRENTERPVTVSTGTNYLVGTDIDKIIFTAKQVINGKGKSGKIPKYWDGEAGRRIVSIIVDNAKRQ